MSISRRQFCEWLAVGSGALTNTPLPTANPADYSDVTPDVIAGPSVAPTGYHIGNLYPFVQQQADQSPLELSFLRP